MLVVTTTTMAQQQDAEEWQRIYHATIDGERRMVFVDDLKMLKIAYADLNGDGEQDLLVGKANGQLDLFLYRNGIYSLEEPQLKSQTNQGVDSSITIDVGTNAAPALVDIDTDGDLDLFVGSGDGRLWIYRNEGNRFVPFFRLFSDNFLGKPFNQDLVPTFADVNADGLADLALGLRDGNITLFMNFGTRDEARYCSDTTPLSDCIFLPVLIANMGNLTYAAPHWDDWDGDGDQDLLVGLFDGSISYFRNIGTTNEGVWEAYDDTMLFLLDIGGYSAVSTMNIDDTKQVILSSNSPIVKHYKRDMPDGDMELENQNVLRYLNIGQFAGYLRVTSGDLNGDGQADLVIGTQNGSLLHYENKSTADDIILNAQQNILPAASERQYSDPALGDVDGDGDLDLLVGSINGRLEFVENIGTPEQPAWVVADSYLGQIDVGSMSAPFLMQLDGNPGDDLVLGNNRGTIWLLLNTVRPTGPRFGLVSNSFGDFVMQGASVPSIFRYKSIFQLVAGGTEGALQAARRNEGQPISKSGAFRPLRNNQWEKFQVAASSAPHFTNLTQDDKPYLLLGSASDTILVWKYLGEPVVEEQVPLVESIPLEEVTTPDGQEELPLLELAPLTDPIFELLPSPVELPDTLQNPQLAALDIDGDGLKDLLIGTRRGEIEYYKNNTADNIPRFNLVSNNYFGSSFGKNVAPTAVDIDNDGDDDLLIVNDRGQMFIVLNDGSNLDYNLNQINRIKDVVLPSSTSIAAINWGNQLRFIVGQLDGRLDLFDANWAQDTLSLRQVQINFLGLNAGLVSSPAIQYIDQERRLLLAVGSGGGKLSMFLSLELAEGSTPVWERRDDILGEYSVGYDTHPVLFDVDGDGVVDMLVGSEDGGILYFKNMTLQSDLQGF